MENKFTLPILNLQGGLRQQTSKQVPCILVHSIFCCAVGKVCRLPMMVTVDPVETESIVSLRYEKYRNDY